MEATKGTNSINIKKMNNLMMSVPKAAQNEQLFGKFMQM
jgi:hypothetical protein